MLYNYDSHIFAYFHISITACQLGVPDLQTNIQGGLMHAYCY